MNRLLGAFLLLSLLVSCSRDSSQDPSATSAKPGPTSQAAVQQETPAETHNTQVVGISYDSVKILGKFSESSNVRFPLLSDVGSKTIHAFGIHNKKGYPHPGTYIIGPDRKFWLSDFWKAIAIGTARKSWLNCSIGKCVAKECRSA